MCEKKKMQIRGNLCNPGGIWLLAELEIEIEILLIMGQSSQRPVPHSFPFDHHLPLSILPSSHLHVVRGLISVLLPESVSLHYLFETCLYHRSRGVSRLRIQISLVTRLCLIPTFVLHVDICDPCRLLLFLRHPRLSSRVARCFPMCSGGLRVQHGLTSNVNATWVPGVHLHLIRSQ
jgi:hypothetical protein